MRQPLKPRKHKTGNMDTDAFYRGYWHQKTPLVQSGVCF